MKICFVLFAASAACAAPARLTWCMQDVTGAPSPIVYGAAREAQIILGKAGIETTWDRCSPQTPPSIPHVFSVEPLPQALEETYGLALPDARRAYIYTRAVGALARGETTRWMVLLGHVLAHELGHLAGLAHAPEGIMSARWSPTEFYDAMGHRLKFSGKEAACIASWATAPLTSGRLGGAR